MSTDAGIARALAAFGGVAEAPVEPLTGGLIHQSFSVPHRDVECVLQRVNPIFAAGIHRNIAAVTEHLHARGVRTLRLLPAADGRPWADLGPDGVWRLMTRVPGTTFDTCSTLGQARSAAALVASFHSALADLEHDFEPLGFTFHDTDAHLADLRDALTEHAGHPLHAEAEAIARELFDEASRWAPLDGMPARVVHGDLKFNNILFASDSGAGKDTAVSLIDLDTLCRLPLWIEMGDAWRSWCNRAGEDEPEAELDLEVFRASAAGYLGGLTLELVPGERESLAFGLERIALELCSRFTADILRERYFAWEPARFGSAAEHNRVRARGQLSLYHQAVATRDERREMLVG